MGQPGTDLQRLTMPGPGKGPGKGPERLSRAACLFSQLPDSAGTSERVVKRPAPSAPLRPPCCSVTCDPAHPRTKSATALHRSGHLRRLFTVLRNQHGFQHRQTERAYLSDVLVQTVQVSPAEFERIAVLLPTLRSAATARGRRRVVEPGTSPNARHVR